MRNPRWLDRWLTRLRLWALRDVPVSGPVAGFYRVPPVTPVEDPDEDPRPARNARPRNRVRDTRVRSDVQS